MTANLVIEETAMAEAAIAWLRDRLPETWQISPRTEARLQEDPTRRVDSEVELRGPSGTFGTMVIEVRRAFGPRDVDRLLGGLTRTLRVVRPIAILIVAPWLSRRTRELLEAEGVNYLDLTGNARIQLDNPTLFIETHGAAKDPSPREKTKARVQGPKAGRFIRLLADVAPPYGVRELAVASDLTPGYVSRLLDTLDDEALVERAGRGRVMSVDIPRLLRRWAETYDVFRSNTSSRFLAPGGAGDTLPRLASLGSRVAVTGSFAAVRHSAIAAPALLVAYADDPAGIAETLGLLPADEGANVVLLRPFDLVVWERTTAEKGVTFVSPSQIAVDCLTGNGRMPAEGEAMLVWMTDAVGQWRLPGLPEPIEENDG